MLREGEGRVNISYSCYQTESYISTPLELPQVMLKRLSGSQAPEFPCSYRNGGDQSVNNFLKTLSEITAKKNTSKACFFFLMPDFSGGTNRLIFALI